MVASLVESAPIVVSLDIPASRVGDFTNWVERQSRRAVKLGLSAPMLVKGDIVYRGDGVDRRGLSEVHLFTLTCPLPVLKVGNWEFVAAIDHSSPVGNVIRVVDASSPVTTLYRTVKGNCEHCNQARLRNTTYVFRGGSGVYKQVGSTCIADFFGTDVSMVASQFEFLSELREESEDFEAGSGAFVMRTSYYLECVADSILSEGWVSKAMAQDGEGRSTAEAAAIMCGEDHKPSEAGMKLATDARAWARAIDQNTTSDYMHNIRTIAYQDGLGFRAYGLAASIVSSFRKDEDRKREAAGAHTSEYVGTVGDRVYFELKVDRVMSFSTQYGPSHLHIMSDKVGNTLTWQTSAEYMEEGTDVILYGTVKEHEVYKKTGKKQTVLTRCKKVDSIPAPKAAKKGRAKKELAAV